jgi:CBS domain-containing protein
MTAEPVTAASDMPTGAAVILMREYGIRHLVVVDGERPVGLIRFDEAVRSAPVPVGQGF